MRKRLQFLEDSQGPQSNLVEYSYDSQPLLSTNNQEFLVKLAAVISPGLLILFDVDDPNNLETDMKDDVSFPAGVVVIDTLQKFLSFLQYDYHFFLYDELLLNIDSIYSNGIDRNDPLVLTQFCLVMALGVVYDKNVVVIDDFPGYQYYQMARRYLREVESSFSLLAIQTHILFTWYLLILNQKGLALIHSACAVRKALYIGLHKNPDASISSVAKEHMSRTWWTVFVTDMLCVSILGTPQNIRLDQVDAPLPSQTELGSDEVGLFFDHTYFTLNIRLAVITSKVLSTIYSKSFTTGQRMLQIFSILDTLEEFKHSLPEEIKPSFENFSSNKRKDASLILFYNQTTILALRPVFLDYVNLANADPSKLDDALLSSRQIKTGVAAASSTIELLKYCKKNNMISKLGFYDSSYLYSAMLLMLAYKLMKEPQKGFFEMLEPLSILQYQSACGNICAQSISNEINTFFGIFSSKK